MATLATRPKVVLLLIASAVFACSSGHGIVGGTQAPPPSAVPVKAPPAPSKQTMETQQTAPHRELPPRTEVSLRGRIDELDNRLSHQRSLVSAEPWGNRAGTEPLRLTPPTRMDIERARRTRRSRRAFDGAPPVMGHSLRFGGEHSCLHCHSNGMTIGARIARPMSHAELPNCTQCHIESKNEWLDERTMPANDFVGYWSEQVSERAADGAPPTIPHSTFLRTTCLSCHGQYGYEGLRTSHPERANCVQCHVER